MSIVAWYRRQPRWLQKALFVADVYLNWKYGKTLGSTGELGETLSEGWAENRGQDPKADAACEVLNIADSEKH